LSFWFQVKVVVLAAQRAVLAEVMAVQEVRVKDSHWQVKLTGHSLSPQRTAAVVDMLCFPMQEEEEEAGYNCR
jgi:hypothetical protein